MSNGFDHYRKERDKAVAKERARIRAINSNMEELIAQIIDGEAVYFPRELSRLHPSKQPERRDPERRNK